MSFASVSRASSRRVFVIRTLVRSLSFVVLLCAAASVRAAPKFMGYFYEGPTPRFSLTNAEGTNARWVAPGESFDGYKVESFDKQAGKLTLSREGERIEILLNVAHVKDSKVEELARLRGLDGIARAQELARRGHTQLGELLKRRQQVLDAPDGDQKSKYALDYLNTRVEEVTRQQMAVLEKEATAASREKSAGR
jgi:hypothetical protein